MLLITVMLMSVLHTQVSSHDWEEALRKQVLQFDFCTSLFDVVVSSGIICQFIT